jgi:hypothetical protein
MGLWMSCFATDQSSFLCGRPKESMGARSEFNTVRVFLFTSPNDNGAPGLLEFATNERVPSQLRRL